jgi:DNA-binding GntR family transcriptional regulator
MLTPTQAMNSQRTPKSSGSSTDRVYQAVYQAVLEHRLQPGEWLREEELAQQFGVSRTVVRQALLRLAQDNAVELKHNHGARVALPSMEDAAHVFEARRTLECAVAKGLGGQLSGDQLRQLQALAEAESAADQRGDRTDAVRLSGEFHAALARMHGNPIFVRMLNGLLPTTSLLMARFKLQGDQVCVAHRHVDLIAALQRSGANAGAEMRKHLDELERSLVNPPQPRQRPLRDAFAGYREQPPKPHASATITVAATKAHAITEPALQARPSPKETP